MIEVKKYILSNTELVQAVANYIREQHPELKKHAITVNLDINIWNKQASVRVGIES